MTDFKMQILNAVFNLAGTVISQTIKGDENAYEKLHEDYYRKTTAIAQKAEKNEEKNRNYQYFLNQQRRKEQEPEEEPEQEYVAIPEKDLSVDKIEKGTACLACVPPDSLVFANPGLKQIIELNMTDRVLERAGEYT